MSFSASTQGAPCVDAFIRISSTAASISDDPWLSDVQAVATLLVGDLACGVSMSQAGNSTPSVDPYGLLELSRGASTKEIASAYRRKALKCHPDKNAGNPGAAHLFHQLTAAYESLMDETSRRVIDDAALAREARAVREQKLSTERRAMRDDLLERERQARRRKVEEAEREERAREDVLRTRRQEASGGAMAAEQGHRAQVPSSPGAAPSSAFDDLDRTIKVKLAMAGGSLFERRSTDNYSSRQTVPLLLTEEYVRSLFRDILHGSAIESIAVSKSATSALVQFRDVTAARASMAIDFEEATARAVLFSWAKGFPPALPSQVFKGRVEGGTIKGGGPSHIKSGALVDDKDFESITLMRMRQHAERARLRLQLDERAVNEAKGERQQPDQEDIVDSESRCPTKKEQAVQGPDE